MTGAPATPAGLTDHEWAVVRALRAARAAGELGTLELMTGAYRDVRQRRLEQDAEQGGPTHDDTNVPEDWLRLILKFYRRGYDAASTQDLAGFRDCLIHVAALAIAGVESHDRRHRKDRPAAEASLRRPPYPGACWCHDCGVWDDRRDGRSHHAGHRLSQGARP